MNPQSPNFFHLAKLTSLSYAVAIQHPAKSVLFHRRTAHSHDTDSVAIKTYHVLLLHLFQPIFYYQVRSEEKKN